MSGLLLHLVNRQFVLNGERLSGLRAVVTIIGIIVVGVLVLTPLAGWEA